jgi:hypothetical protein
MKYSFVFLLSFLITTSFAQSASAFKKSYLFKVSKNDKQVLYGVFSHTTDSSVVILDEFNDFVAVHIPVVSIKTIEVKRFNSEKRNTLAGALIGFGIGFTIGWEAYDSPGSATLNQAGHAAGGGLLGGFIGAFIGHLTSGISTSYTLGGSISLYERIRPQLDSYSRR